MLVEDVMIRILGILYDDLRADGDLQDLRTCALVHRAFTRTCQRYLFCAIRLGKSSVDRRLETILTQSPLLALDVQEVELQMLPDPDPPMWPTVLHQLSNTTTLRIVRPGRPQESRLVSGFDWRSARRTPDKGVPQAIAAIAFLPNLECLSVTNIEFSNVLQLFKLCTSASLRHVHVHECRTLSLLYSIDAPPAWPPVDELGRTMDAQLESITITTVYSTYLESFFVKWLATTSSATTLRRVALSPMGWRGDHRHSPSSLIPQEALPCLQHLCLDCRRLRATLTSEPPAAPLPHTGVTRLELIYNAHVPSLEHAFAAVYRTDFPALAELVIRFCGADADMRAFSDVDGGWWDDPPAARPWAGADEEWWSVRPRAFPARLLHTGRLRAVELAFEGVRRILDPGELLAAFADVQAAGLLRVAPESLELLRDAPQSAALRDQLSN